MALAQLSGAVVNDGINGKNNIILSDTAPVDPEEGQLWQNTSMPVPQTISKWTGAEWDDEWGVGAQNMIANALSAITAILGDITSGSITNGYSYVYQGITHNVVIQLDNDITITDVYVSNGDTYEGTISLLAGGYGQGLNIQLTKNGVTQNSAWYTAKSISLTDNVNNAGGTLTSENMTLVPWTNLTFASGYTSKDNTTVQYRKTKNLDGSYTIELRGAVGKTSGSLTTVQVAIGTLPAGYRPSQIVHKQAPIDGSAGARCSVSVDGAVMIWPNATTNYVGLDVMSFAI